MSWAQLAEDVTFYAFFVASKQGKTGLTVTVDVTEDTAGGTATAIVSGGSATEVSNGVYKYRLTGANVDAEGCYVAVFKTADATVDQQWIPALWIVGKAGVENLDAAISTRNATTPPTAAAISDAVWDEVISGHAVTGSTGAALSAAGGAADPLLNAVPGSYATGSAGAALGRIGSNTVTVVSPVATNGDISLYYGDDYYTTDAQSLSFSGTNWPTITGGTVSLRVQGSTGVVAIAGTVTSGSACVVEVTQANTYSIGVGVWSYDLEATLSNSHVRTLQYGLCTVTQDVR